MDEIRRNTEDMYVYGEDEAARYDKVISQPVYRFYVNKKLGLIQRWLTEKSILLDVGCGTGTYTNTLSKWCSMIVGMDLSPKMVEIAKTKAKKLSLQNAHFVLGDVAHLPFRDLTFDLVFSVNLFHHIVDKNIIKTGFSEQVRCGRPRGHVLVFELNPNSLGWSADFVPRTARKLVYLLLYPFSQKVIDNVEEGTRIVSFSELEEGVGKTKVVYKKVGGFIPTYCPKALFKSFILLEKSIESAPLLRRYGAHVLLVGEVSR